MFKSEIASWPLTFAAACAVIPTPILLADEHCESAWQSFEVDGQVGVGGTGGPFLNAVTVWNGSLVAGGFFITAGGQKNVNHIAHWDGSAWLPLSSGGQTGVGGVSLPRVDALTAYNGDLIAGGNFVTAGGQTVNRIARWDGEAWHPFTAGGQIGLSGNVYALTVWNGDLIAGGLFNTGGGQTVNRIARWDGEQWHPFTSGGQTGTGGYHGEVAVHELTVWNGDLVAGGSFWTVGGKTVYGIARWDGSAWHPFASGGQIGVNGEVHALTVYNGDLIAGGGFTWAGGQTVNRIARWDGSAWHPLTSGGQIGVDSAVRALTVWSGSLVAGGNFTTAGGQTVNFMARWDGSAWHPFTSGGQIGVGNASVRALTTYNGDLIAGGWFTSAGGQTVNRIASWDGEAWHAFTSGGQGGVNGTHQSGVLALTEWNDELIVGGDFSKAGGQWASKIVRWDDSAWHPFIDIDFGQNGVSGDGSQSVSALTEWNGDLVAGGTFTIAAKKTVFRIARWDGSTWHQFISGGQIGVGGVASPTVRALTVWQGDLVAGGVFTTAGGQTVNGIARWHGATARWYPFTAGGQTGMDHWVQSLTVWSGDLIAGGSFTTAGGQTVNGIARWDGEAWHPFTSGGQIGVGADGDIEVSAVTVWNDDLIAGGSFTTAGGQILNGIARWDGEAWHPFASGGEVGMDNSVHSLAVRNGHLIAGGEFAKAGGQTVNNIARWDGATWRPLTDGGQIGVNNAVFSLTVWNGDLIAGGWLDTAGGQTANYIARWVCLCPGDLTGDDFVGTPDLLALLACWGPVAPGSDCEPADLTGSGSVGVPDLLALLAAWGPCP